MLEPERRTWQTVLLSSIGNGALIGIAAGAAAGLAIATVSMLMGPLWDSSNLLGTLLVGDVFGGFFGALLGSIFGLLTGLTGGLLLVAAGGSRLKRSTARAIGAVSPPLTGLLIGVWAGSLEGDVYVVLVLTAIGAPLGSWRAPRIAYGSPSQQIP